jgi:tetratricopeptide (TPR) repeat protein
VALPIGLAAAAAAAVFVVARPRLAAPGSTVDVPADAQVELRVGRGASVRVRGPARLAVDGAAGAVHLRLDSGELEASVDKRRPGETFVVELRQGWVEVRGTRFSVGYAGSRAWVRVAEGRVAVYRAGEAEERAVSAGEMIWLEPATQSRRAAPGGRRPADTRAVEPGSEAPGPTEAPRSAFAPASGGEAVACPDARRICQTGAARARAAMREGASGRALRIMDATRRGWGGARACPAPPEACVDELIYLRAEALQLEGQLGAALEAYRALDREGAPAAARQNALYAAAEIERRLGRHAAAWRDFDRAFAIAPAGALREEAMAGAMEAAAAAGDEDAAVDRARRYLRAFPAGLAVVRAREILGRGAGPAGRP